MMQRSGKFVLVSLILFGVLLGYQQLAESPLMVYFTDFRFLAAEVHDLGVLGPVLLIGLMTVAVVFNPIPSAPIALVAGSVYGHLVGAFYIVLGAELGAIIAFLVARWIGYDFVRRHIGDTRHFKRFNSQNSLTALVFVSRLVPFVSFDLVSYAAGLSPISFWRFALATLFGLVPVSFALAHFGEQLETIDLRLFILVIVVIVALPLLFHSRMLRRGESGTDDST